MKARILKMKQHQTMQQHMTSIEIADISGEQHQDVMKTIKKMEPVWEKMNANDLLSFLTDKGIVHKMNGHYELTRKYRNEGLARYRYSVRYNSRGRRKKRSTIVWTEAGRQFINDMIE